MKGPVDKSFYQVAPITISLLFLFLIYLLHSIGQGALQSISGGIILVILFIAAFFIESRYVPSVGVLPNLVMLYLIVEKSAEPVPLAMNLYLFAGITLGITAYLLSNLKNIKGKLYEGTVVLYSLKTILPLYLSYYLLGSFSHQFIIYSFVLFAVISWAFYLYVGT
jgi:hypothetical protein